MTTESTDALLYGREFYATTRDASRATADVVVPLLAELVHPQSVVDIGCGIGNWLAAWRECGVTDILGIDGDYVDRSLLAIPEERFRPQDLARPLSLDRTFDLAMSLEVAEHLPAAHAREFVRSLCAAAPVVVFSAAVPEQPGVNHINCQWPWYWHRLFREEGYVVLDAVRPRIWYREGAHAFYKQNIFVMVRRERWASDAALGREPLVTTEEPMVLVSGSVLVNNLRLRAFLRRLPELLREGMERRLRLRPYRNPWE
jgi:SAM-dependent methyltransferase